MRRDNPRMASEALTPSVGTKRRRSATSNSAQNVSASTRAISAAYDLSTPSIRSADLHSAWMRLADRLATPKLTASIPPAAHVGKAPTAQPTTTTIHNVGTSTFSTRHTARSAKRGMPFIHASDASARCPLLAMPVA